MTDGIVGKINQLTTERWPMELILPKKNGDARLTGSFSEKELHCIAKHLQSYLRMLEWGDRDNLGCGSCEYQFRCDYVQFRAQLFERLSKRTRVALSWWKNPRAEDSSEAQQTDKE